MEEPLKDPEETDLSAICKLLFRPLMQEKESFLGLLKALAFT